MCVCVCVDDVYVCVLICNGEKFELDTSTMASALHQDRESVELLLVLLLADLMGTTIK